MANLKFRLRGEPMIAPRDDAGNPLGFNPAGCADEAKIDLAVDTFTHVEKCSGQDLEDFRGTKKKSGTFSLDLTEWTTPNVLLALNGTRIAPEIVSPPAAVADEALPDDLEVGQKFLLGGRDPHVNITGATFEDSASPPNAVSASGPGAKLSIDAENGVGTVLDLAGVAQPIRASYSYQDDEKIAMLSAGTVERWVSFVGINTAQSNKPVRVNLYRVVFDPASIDLLPDELGHLPLKGSILADSTKSASGALGQFGMISRA